MAVGGEAKMATTGSPSAGVRGGGRGLGHPLHVETPLVRSEALSDRAGCSVWLKLENVQHSGSFKIRGLGYHCQKVG